jgi:hypothetical protein
MSQTQMFKIEAAAPIRDCFGHLDFEFLICFGFRASDFVGFSGLTGRHTSCRLWAEVVDCRAKGE